MPETISRISLAVRSELANVGNSPHDRPSAERCTRWSYFAVLNHTKFISFGSSQFSLSVCQTPTESMTSMLITTVSEPSTNSSGMTSNPSPCRGPGPISRASGNTRSSRRTRVAPASCPLT